MFVETIIAAFLIGFLACYAIAAVAIWRVEQVHRKYQRPILREQRVRAYRAEVRRRHLEDLRREHKGTPYIAPTELEKILAAISPPDLDDHNGSRRASKLEVVR